MLTANVGALSILIPIALRLERSERSSASALLMPMSFLSLLDGLVTLVGTSTGDRFGDYRRLGLPLSILVIVVGVSLIAWLWPTAA